MTHNRNQQSAYLTYLDGKEILISMNLIGQSIPKGMFTWRNVFWSGIYSDYLYSSKHSLCLFRQFKCKVYCKVLHISTKCLSLCQNQLVNVKCVNSWKVTAIQRTPTMKLKLWCKKVKLKWICFGVPQGSMRFFFNIFYLLPLRNICDCFLFCSWHARAINQKKPTESNH